jgi:hypothetical protein
MWRLTLAYCLFFTSTFASANIFIEPRFQFTGSNRLSNASMTERSVSVGSYINWDTDYFTIRFNGDYRYDTIFNSKFSTKAKNKYQSYLWLDEFYIEKNWSAMNIYFGYQKVVWGQADELRVVDVINPLDFRQFILMDLNDYMISLPMLRITSDVIPDWNIEGIWIMQYKSNRYSPPGSAFYIKGTADTAQEKPNNGEFGISASTNIKGIDLGLYAFSGFTDDPVYKIAASGEMIATYPTENMLGFSLSTALDNWVVRVESAYFPNKYYNNNNLQKVKHDTFKGLIGIDYLYQDWMITGQISDRYIKSWSDQLAVSSSDTFYTLSVEGKVLSDKLSLRFSNTWSASDGGGNLLQSKLKYQYDSHLSFQMNLDVISGSSRNFIGSMSDSDRIYYSITYRF